MGIGREVSAHYLYNYIVYIDCGRPLVTITVGWAWGPELYINPFLPLCQLIIHSKPRILSVIGQIYGQREPNG